MNIANEYKSFRRKQVIVWQYCKDSVDQIILWKLGFLDKIFSKKTILFISNKVYKDLKAKKVR